MMKQSSPSRPRGPRQDGVRAREAILAAARDQFAAHGYGGATMRAIAAAAGVDVALVSYYFGSKSGLFVQSLRLPVNPAEAIEAVLAEGTDDLGRRLVRRLLTVWDDPVTGGPLISIVRSASSQPDMLREFVERQVAARLSRAIDAPDAELRAAAIAAQALGLIFMRYVLHLEPLASAGHDEIVELVGPTIQRYLDADGQPPSSSPPPR
jgi:AcrR family transcriptional regulator